jgi:hypothetical protein
VGGCVILVIIINRNLHAVERSVSNTLYSLCLTGDFVTQTASLPPLRRKWSIGKIIQILLEEANDLDPAAS